MSKRTRTKFKKFIADRKYYKALEPKLFEAVRAAREFNTEFILRDDEEVRKAQIKGYTYILP